MDDLLLDFDDDDAISLGDYANNVDDLMESLMMGCSFREIDELVEEERRRSQRLSSGGSRRASRRSTYLLE